MVLIWPTSCVLNELICWSPAELPVRCAAPGATATASAAASVASSVTILAIA